jgi:hypothetical protein
LIFIMVVEGFSVNAVVAKNYHVFRIHWCAPNTTSTRMQQGGGGGMQEGSPSLSNATPEEGGSAPTYIGMIPAVLTNDELIASQRDAAGWIQLRDVDYLTVGGDGDAADGSIYYPTGFVTRECAVCRSSLSSSGARAMSRLDTADIIGKGRDSGGEGSQWEAMLLGVVRQSIASLGDVLFGGDHDQEVNRRSYDRCRPCVSFMRFDGSSSSSSSSSSSGGGGGGGGLSIVHSTFTCATYRASNSASVGDDLFANPLGSPFANPLGSPLGMIDDAYILALDRTGKVVHKIESRSSSSSSSHTLIPTDQWAIGRAMSSLWAAPLGKSSSSSSYL